jgi:DNA-binding MarR family transcriptional regulator
VPVSKPDLDAVALALNSGAIHLLRSLAAVDRLAGLTPARLSALSVLVFGGPQTLGGLASQEGVAGPTMSRIVDALTEDGLAERRPYPQDARAVEVCATERGESLMRAAAGRRISAISAALAELPAEDQRRLARTAGLLDQVAGVIRERPPPGPADGADSRSPTARGRRGR